MTVYRGMSQAELDAARETGYFTTDGRLNASHAVGCYCVSTDINEARFYAFRNEGIVVQLEVPEFYGLFKDYDWSTELQIPIGLVSTKGVRIEMPISSFVCVVSKG